ncbi:HSP20-like chaperone [Obba rivulosa]|uniref:HSP20-like chaperone n=1 Tax=Obba rivulosa TaxID=1052685 RepID=A0A8E2B3X7_9APHY|nr:HSP20-like chaperone [Obba rivulosa]
MSLARHFFRELRPLFRMLDQPLGRSGFPEARVLSLFDDPFFRSPAALQPAVDVKEEKDKYIVEAEVPGVRKEDIDVRIGDGGKSITIEGRVTRRGEQQATEAPSGSGVTGAGTSAAGDLTEHESQSQSQTQAMTKSSEQNQLSSERSFVDSTTFTRTVWLPRPVDAKNVSAKLDHGILTLTVPKAQDPDSVKVNIE